MAYDPTQRTNLDRTFVDASAALTELEAVRAPTGWARGRLAAIRLSRLEPDSRNRAEALLAKWAQS